MKRLLDVFVSVAGLVGTSIVTVPAMVAVWLQDYRSPLYIAPRVKRGGGTFRMVKLRSMVVRADRTGVDSTAGDDPRITAVGRFIRRYKLDEVTQLWNVLKGDMSLVGPRPNVEREVALYTEEERRLLQARPGITDLASIVFADEGEILRGSSDPDLLYHQIIRPWKSRLALLNASAPPSLARDLKLIWLTARNSFDRDGALDEVSRMVRELGGDDNLAAVATRRVALQPAPPPGAERVVESRDC